MNLLIANLIHACNGQTTPDTIQAVKTILENEKDKIRMDLLDIAEKGELEELRREVENYNWFDQPIQNLEIKKGDKYYDGTDLNGKEIVVEVFDVYNDVIFLYGVYGGLQLAKKDWIQGLKKL